MSDPAQCPVTPPSSAQVYYDKAVAWYSDTEEAISDLHYTELKTGYELHVQMGILATRIAEVANLLGL